MKRTTPLCTGQTHHVYSKSINHFKIFNSPDEYERFIQLIQYYRHSNLTTSFSQITRSRDPENLPEKLIKAATGKNTRVSIMAYCLMPTHFHLILNQTEPLGIERFISDTCNAYSHYFNLRHNRKGPLWQNRFGNSCIYSTQELIETSRYVHLNPTTAYLCKHPSKWPYSSFLEYINKRPQAHICDKNNILEKISSRDYEMFVVRHIKKQRQIKQSKIA